MRNYPVVRIFCIFVLLGTIFFLPARDAFPFDYALSQSKGVSRITLHFGQALDSFSLQRTGEKSLRLVIPPALVSDGKSGAIPQNSELIGGIQRDADGLTVTLKNNAFGFLRYQTDKNRTLVIDVFPDPLGAKWTPPPTAEAPGQQAESAGAAASGTNRAATPEEPAPQNPASDNASRPSGASNTPVRTDAALNQSSPAGSTPAQQVLPAAPDGAQSNATANATIVSAPSSAAPAQTEANLTNSSQDAVGVNASASDVTGGPSSSAANASDAGQAGTPSSPNADQTPVAASSAANQTVTEQPATNQTAQPVQSPAGAPAPISAENSTVGNDTGPVLDLPPVEHPEYNDGPPGHSLLNAGPSAGTPERSGYYLSPTSFRGSINRQVAAPGREDSSGSVGAGQQPSTGDESYLDGAQNQTLNGSSSESLQPPDNTTGALQQQSLNPDQPAQPSAMELLTQAQQAIDAGNFDRGRDILSMLAGRSDLAPAFMEQVLYSIADLGFIRYRTKDELTANYKQVMHDLNAAISYNPESRRMPAAYLKLSIINLKLGNYPEAKAYFNILTQQYPHDDVIPILYFSWAEAYMNNKQYQKAADLYQKVLQDYSEHKLAREAAVNLTVAMSELGYDRQAYDAATYIERRWPRYYMESLPFLKLLGDVSYRVDDFDKAKRAYWGYYNLAPNEDDSDMVLAKLGDIYMKSKQKDAAVEVYRLAVDRFPERDGAIISKIRLAESGVYDQPSVVVMNGVFDKPGEGDPAQIYMDILSKHPDSPFAKVALVKLGMYHIWQKDYRLAIETLNRFPELYPGDPLLAQAQAAAQEALDGMIQNLVKEGNYAPVVQAWNDYPILHQGEMTNAGKVGLALSLWKQGDPDAALKILHPFFQGPMVPTYSDMALQMAAAIHLERKDWPAIIELADNTALWDINEHSRSELDYALALAYENMGMPDKSGPLWIRLANNPILPLERRGYPLYFLAVEAKNKQNLDDAKRYGEEALSALLNAKPQDTEKIKNLLYILVAVNESAGHLEMALQWSAEYAKMLTPEEPEWAAERYQTAQLFLRLGDRAKWGQTMEEIANTLPDSRYGRLAALELSNYRLEKSAKDFSNG